MDVFLLDPSERLLPAFIWYQHKTRSVSMPCLTGTRKNVFINTLRLVLKLVLHPKPHISSITFLYCDNTQPGRSTLNLLPFAPCTNKFVFYRFQAPFLDPALDPCLVHPHRR